MRKERQILKVSSLLLNDGRLGWLPANPRQWTAADLDRIANSIQTDPDFLEDRPVLVVPCDKKYIVFGGNMRREGSNKVGLKEIPAVIYYPETDADRDTIKRRAILDNGAFGAWDFDALANEWDDLPLTDWGVPAWKEEKDEGEKEHEDISHKIDPVFQICIDCDNEEEQERIYNELKDTYKCRVLTL